MFERQVAAAWRLQTFTDERRRRNSGGRTPRTGAAWLHRQTTDQLVHDGQYPDDQRTQINSAHRRPQSSHVQTQGRASAGRCRDLVRAVHAAAPRARPVAGVEDE